MVNSAAMYYDFKMNNSLIRTIITHLMISTSKYVKNTYMVFLFVG